MLTKIAPPRDGIRYRVLAYLRVSVEDERTNSHTIGTQRDRIVEKLDALYGRGNYDVEWFEDNGRSGAYGPLPTRTQRRTRAELRAVVERLDTRKYDCLAVYSLSRFCRSPRWFYQILEDNILPSGATFVSASEGFDVTDRKQRMAAGMTAIVDASFRDDIVDRCRDAARSRAEAGFPVGAKCFGWKPEPREELKPGERRGIVRDEEQGRWVVRIANWYLGGWSSFRIAEELNSLGVPSPSGTALWGFTTVINTLSNPLHAGLIGFKGELLQGRHHEIRYYDRDVYERILETKRTRTCWSTDRKTGELHLLAGIVTCARCGKRLYMAQASGYASYRCVTGHAQGRRTCPDVRVQCSWIEPAVVEAIARLSQCPVRSK